MNNLILIATYIYMAGAVVVLSVEADDMDDGWIGRIIFWPIVFLKFFCKELWKIITK